MICQNFIQITDSILSDLKCLWQEEKIIDIIKYPLKYFDANKKYYDTTPYFMNDIDRISAEEYVPTYQDILRMKYRTTGVIEKKFKVDDGVSLHVFDVGGVRSERKKWVNCFNKVTSVIFVASLSNYDLGLYEDLNANSMVESIKLFEELVNDKHFKQRDFILLLNKRDLFRKKIQTIPITVCPAFKDFKGNPHDYDATITYIKQVFERQKKDGNKAKEIHTFVTCAFDTKDVEKVLKECSKLSIEQHLELKSRNIL